MRPAVGDQDLDLCGRIAAEPCLVRTPYPAFTSVNKERLMSSESDSRRDLGLPEHLVDRVLQRAVALDAEHSTRVPLTRLYDIAREAGVSPNALAAALAEVERYLASTRAGVPLVLGVSQPPVGWRAHVVRNVAALIGGASGLALLGSGFDTFGVPAPARSVVLIGALTLIASGATRLGARAVRILALGFAVYATVEFLIGLNRDWQLHGAAAQSGAMIAAVVGVAVGALLRGRAATGPTAGDAGAASAEERVEPTVRENARRWQWWFAPISHGAF
jgi:hypothetical protein